MPKLKPRPVKIDWEQLDRLGQMADTADNFLVYADSTHGFAKNVPTETRFDALKTGLTEIRDKIKSLVVEVSGDDPWGDSPASGGVES